MSVDVKWQRMTLALLRERGELDGFRPGFPYTHWNSIPAYREGVAESRCPECGSTLTPLYFHRVERFGIEVKVIATCDNRTCDHAELV